MGIREALNKYPYLGYAAIPVIAIVVILAVRSAKNTEPSAFHSAFYSVDEGKTFFTDDAELIPPFDHRGKQAVRAHVFTGSDGKQFVGYLEKLTPEAAEGVRRMRLRKPTDPPLPMSEMSTVLLGHQYKRPGDKSWVGASDMGESGKVKSITGPDGSPLTEVDAG